MRQILFALDGLHSTAIVHRDMKLQNVTFSEGSRTFKIIDPGAAADLRAGIDYIPKGVPLHFPLYSGRYQCNLELRNCDSASCIKFPLHQSLLRSGCSISNQLNLPDRFDIYSTGLIFLQMASTGSLPSVDSYNFALIQFNRQLKRCDYDLVARRETVEQRACPDLCKCFEMLDLDGGIGWELLTLMIRYKACRRTNAKSALAHPYFDREGLLALSFMQKLRLQLFRTTQQNYGEAVNWIIRLMSRSGSPQDGCFTEAQLQELWQKATTLRNALASALRHQRKIIRTINESID
ncbi:hypothetical protein MLD38_004389 [Melastoma candidum]|uniref:Uncharacterized protein n=1 Tax=Melastoma candidum TaxID=119954 RepID=A0ACB9S592_9MYRT|nr:hypothetical protein MLD38_004389 [Melastoma candidum]